MKRFLKIVFSLTIMVAAVISCDRSARVIPAGKMEKIYREMLLADQWLADNPEKRTMADTTWFYEPIFRKYGFTLNDYQKSVDVYLNDPKRYADMLGRVETDLRKEMNAINAEISLRDRLQHEADSIVRAWKSVKAKRFDSFMDVYEHDAMTDRIGFRKDSLLGWRLVPVIEDTIYHGPALVIRDTTETACVDSLSVPSEPSASLDSMVVSAPEILKRKPDQGKPLTSPAMSKRAIKRMELSPMKDLMIKNE